MFDHDEASEDGSTGYSEFCDDDIIRSAQPTQRDSPYPYQIAAGCSSATPSSDTLGKRKPPEGPSDRPTASYKRRTIGSPIDPDSTAPLPPSSEAALFPTPPPSNFAPEERHDDGPEPYIIAHNASVQQAMDARGLPWGVQWEIARLISLGHCSWNDITMSALDLLRTKGLSPSGPDSPTLAVLSARVAPYVEDLFRWNKHSFGNQKPSRENLATSPWQELDKEDYAFNQYGPNSYLGCLPELGNFYGGKVSFSMRLALNKQGVFQFTMEHPALGPSCRFTRHYGSGWLIKLRLSMNILSRLDRLKNLLLKPLILNGQVYRFFYANKDHHVYLMATNEYDGSYMMKSSLLSCQRRFCSFLGFFEEHNNLEQNWNQTTAKWAARTALGLSNSIPAIVLDKSEIREEDDIVSSSCPPGVKHSSEMDMTDGCGLINLYAIHMLHERLGLWKEVPVAIQCRLAGAKGLLLLHPGKEENSWEYPCVWLRPSQIKIQHTQSYLDNLAHRTIDVLRASQMQTSVQISREIITNLSENGVSSDIFTYLIHQAMENTISSLLKWDGQDSMAQLWATISKEFNVMATRIARESSWTARARGIQPYDHEDYEVDDDDNSFHSSAWWGDDISGCPSTLEETIMAFLDTGFHPATNPMLAEKLHIVAKMAVKSYISKFRVTIPMSCSALIVPDVLGVLQEGEIHIKCSQRCLLKPDGQRSDRVIGDVLVTRSPCKLPTDVQKVKAVFKPELDDYVNVIIFSIRGSRSLASMLGTGDYDGDRVVCIWQPSIVDQFKNADAKYMEPSIGLSKHFHIKNESVKDFLQRVPSTSPISHQIQELQMILMGPLCDPYVVGTYSTMHDNAIYSLGYSHPTTILLAWIFCTVLDGAKTGKTILPKRYSQDRNNGQYGMQFVPYWKMTPDHSSHQYDLSRQGLPPFVMDLLKGAMESTSNEQLRRIADHFSALPRLKDLDLIVPWEEAQARAQEMASRPEQHVRHVGQAQKDGLDAIKTHVERVHDLYTDLMRATATTTGRHEGSDAVIAGSGAAGVGVGIGSSRGAATAERRGSGGSSSSNRGSGSGAEFTNRSIETRQDQLRRMSREFVGGPAAAETFAFSQEEVARLRASYAYLYDWTLGLGGSRFPWNVAMRELGAIKLRARKDFKPISQDFYEKMSIRKL